MKDAKGHGSDGRGGGDSSFTPYPKGTRFVKGTLLTRGEMTQQTGINHSKAATYAPASQGKATDIQAAQMLASGPKSAPVATHPAMNSQGTIRTPSGHNYNAGAVDAAIASSNRSGRRIGGREASLIHRLLRG